MVASPVEEHARVFQFLKLFKLPFSRTEHEFSATEIHLISITRISEVSRDFEKQQQFLWKGSPLYNICLPLFNTNAIEFDGLI